jgi:hypothetical protein
VRFLVIGPAPSCQVAGRFALAGHKGLNKVAFRGRVGRKVLPRGVYTIVPQLAAGSRTSPKTVAVAIDARGIRPTAPVRWRNCEPVAGASTVTAGTALPVRTQRASGIAAAEAIRPSSPQQTAEKRPDAVFGWLQSIPASPQLSTLLIALLLVSFALLGIAAVEPGDLSRYRSVRVLAQHQGEIAWLGAALLASVIVFFFLM